MIIYKIIILSLLLTGCASVHDPNYKPIKRFGACEEVEPNVRIGEVIIKDGNYCEIVDSHDVDRRVRHKLHLYDAHHRLFFYGYRWPGFEYRHYKAKSKIQKYKPKSRTGRPDKKRTSTHKNIPYK